MKTNWNFRISSKIDDNENESAEQKLRVQLQDAEKAVKDGEGWLTLDELKEAMEKHLIK